ncbi:ammonia-dependent NAD(+) synthetase [Weissella viridescens]|jgi:NAD+ synthase|uniref:ammonia-dependent NAD(+) synthetase n=1 Tax=Weissella viridescens TaxID=1629 RepID=UPI001C7DEDD8|nr:ammonia-dependent NAD(+) synthetase [Weissella viridescens]MBX4173014.1 ammonia-dependent NAD(+) synthetase [Weissella viridescens]MCB6840270.1 ammonia-dependent NAD(+) synthetase [Weissella viridescens]MCB6847002.1 ammonia-dependent NAD(+) synthetase [Weissella viridescens]
MREKQQEIINALGVQPEIDPAKEFRRSVDLLKGYLQSTHLKTYVLGISGGQDSTLAGKMAQTAITELREETGDADYQFIAMRLPYNEQADEQDALDAIAWQNADKTIRVNIQAVTEDTVKEVEANTVEVSDFNKGNIKARQRMIFQYAVAGQYGGLVVGTDHAAEAVTGFYTKFGDGAADITPLHRLDKRQGRQILEYLDAPKHLYEKTPTADLEEDRPALPDEVALGVTYTNIDDYLEGREVPEDVAEKIENWYAKTEHKRQGPVTVFDTWWK